MRTLFILSCLAVCTAGCFFSADEDKIGETNTDTTTFDVDVPIATGSETCVPGTDPIDGLGDTCQGTDDCNDPAPLCQKDPRDTTAPGQCAVAGCLPGCCPAGYSCCTCDVAAVNIHIQTCIPEDMAAELESFCGATACD